MPTSGKFSHSYTNMRWDRPSSRMQLNSAELQEVGQQALKRDGGQKMFDEPQAIFHIQIQFKLQTCFERSKSDSAELHSPGQLVEPLQLLHPPLVPQASLEFQTNRLIARNSAICVKQGQKKTSVQPSFTTIMASAFFFKTATFVLSKQQKSSNHFKSYQSNYRRCS